MIETEGFSRNVFIPDNAVLEVGLISSDEKLTGFSQQRLSVFASQLGPCYYCYTPKMQVKVGDTSALNDKNGECNYINLADFEDKALIKVRLMSDSEQFDIWAKNIAQWESVASSLQVSRGSLEEVFLPTIGLEVKPANKLAVKYDESKAQTTSLGKGIFLKPGGERFALKGRIIYEIYDPDNTYNFLDGEYEVTVGNGSNKTKKNIKRRIGRVNNDFSDKVIYWYRDAMDNTHEIAECDYFDVRPRGYGKIIPSLPSGSISSENFVNRGDAEKNYYYDNGSIVTYGIVLRGTKGYRQYNLEHKDKSKTIELVNMPENLNIRFSVAHKPKVISYTFYYTQRRCCNPGCFAGFIGVLAETSISSIESTGMCFSDATSFPSVTHPNGPSIDTRFIGQSRTRKLTFSQLINEYDEEAEKSLVKAFVDWGFTDVVVGDHKRFNSLKEFAHKYKSDHNNHLHAGLFSSSAVQILNEKTNDAVG